MWRRAAQDGLKTALRWPNIAFKGAKMAGRAPKRRPRGQEDWPKRGPRGSQDGPKRASWPMVAPRRPRGSVVFLQVFVRVRSCSVMGRRTAQDGSKMAGRWPKRRPRGHEAWPKRGPRGSQDGPKMAQGGPRRVPKQPEMAQGGAKTAPRKCGFLLDFRTFSFMFGDGAQVGLKVALRWPKLAPRWRKIAPRRSQDVREGWFSYRFSYVFRSCFGHGAQDSSRWP